MLKLTTKLPNPPKTTAFTLTLPYEKRIITRQRVMLDQGLEAGLFLERGGTLQQGDCLQAETGEQVRIQAALEAVSTVYCEDALLLAQVCYHLGNRHIPLEISAGRVRYLQDHVLDDMVRGLGLSVVLEQASFEPEAGAYAGAHAHNSHPYISFNHGH
ncbi:urease accessory protein UreE [Thiofilum flexile]|uniref:urease accessory protein UreE n=1 Tax=Thiofilum flexile TaxID=125627 RepID=UPI000367F7E6|nr:urease accessory protein UreE [Thiofilum flexile]